MKLKCVFVIGLIMILNKTTYCMWDSDFEVESDETTEEETTEEEDEEAKLEVTINKFEKTGNCPENFVLLNDQCYYISLDKKLDWHQANVECEGMDAELAQIKNDQELDALNEHLVNFQRSWPISLWVAGIDTDSDKEFQWKPHGETITYAKWNINEPTSTFDENCICLKGNNNYLMSDLNCKRKASFICKSKHTEAKIKQICPEKFSLIGNKCYLVEETEHLDYFDAKISCLSLNAKLTKIENNVEIKALNNYLTSHAIGNVWVAGSDLRSEGEYYWDSVDDKMSFTNWGPGQPDRNDLYEHCVELRSIGYDSLMNDRNCHVKLAYICESTPKDPNDLNELTTETITKREKSLVTDEDCPQNFSKVGNKCYFVQHEQKSNWYNADRNCKRIKSDLVTIESSVEMELLIKHLQDVGEASSTWSWARNLYWTAGNDLGNEGHFYWQSNGKSMSYDKWFLREPNNTFDVEHCVNLKYFDDGYYMNDDKCDREMFYVCETNLLKPDLPNTNSGLGVNTNLKLDVNTCSELDLLKINLASQKTVMKMMYSKLSCNSTLV